MPSIREEKPDTLPDFLNLVEEFQTNAIESMWYRGCGRRSYTLVPSLYRHKKAKTLIQLATLERNLMSRFRQRSLPYHSRSLENDWDTLFFMQHYGIPTRLLDWTENPFTALHFALMGAHRKINAKGKYNFDEPATVWILDPVKWNRHALSKQSFDGGTLTPGDEALNGYKPNLTFSGTNSQPVALYGAYNSPRIVAQQGVFTIFGDSKSPMEKLYRYNDFPDGSLVRVTIKSSSIASMRKSLLSHGITESVVFPDLEGLALEIKRSFGFEE